MADQQSPQPGKKTLAGVVGVLAATLILTFIPHEESGRTVNVSIDKTTGAATVTHISGPQYLKVYLDLVGVATACDGLTKGMKLGQKYTDQQCTEMLEAELIDTSEHIRACAPQLFVVGREYPLAASVSLAHNIGWPRFCSSTAARLFRAKSWRAGCNSFWMWRKAGGRIVKGLVDRRARETTLCLKGAA